LEYDFDLLCIGSGPAGQRAAVQTAKLGKRAALVERRETIGGVCLDTGTIPSKTFREAVSRSPRPVPVGCAASPTDRPATLARVTVIRREGLV
jgi:heterodisulfide reductase subunit A-like polyferredoxin